MKKKRKILYTCYSSYLCLIISFIFIFLFLKEYDGLKKVNSHRVSDLSIIYLCK